MVLNYYSVIIAESCRDILSQKRAHCR